MRPGQRRLERGELLVATHEARQAPLAGRLHAGARTSHSGELEYPYWLVCSLDLKVAQLAQPEVALGQCGGCRGQVDLPRLGELLRT